MAEDTSHPKQKKVVETRSASFPRYSILHIELTICELKQIPSPNGNEKDHEAKYSYSAKTKDVSHHEAEKSRSFTIGWCEFSANKEVAEKPRAEVTATYLFVFADPTERRSIEWDNQSVTEAVISFSIWPRFRDLVAHMMAQGSTVFPPLPFEPHKITHVSRKGSLQTA